MACIDPFPLFGFWGAAGRSFPFPHLQSFSCWQGSFSIGHIMCLKGCPRLTSLNILVYEGIEPVYFGHWPELHTLRLEFYRKLRRLESPLKFPDYAHLTTLAINDHIGSEWLDGHLRQAHFPCLRVLNLRCLVSPPWLVYQFIHRHPTLLEVNIGYDQGTNHWFAWDRLVKLIDGTGTWGPTSPANPDPNFDDPEFHRDGIPDLRTETYTVSNCFAFSRVPLSLEATQWDQPSGSPQPRYTATGLAMYIVDQCFWEDHGTEVMRFHQFMAQMHRVFPRMEELRLAYGTPYATGSFEGVMRSCAASLRQWAHLRALTFSWSMLHDEEGAGNAHDGFKWHEGPICESHILDEVHPPIHVWRDDVTHCWSPWRPLEWPRTGDPYTARDMTLARDAERTMEMQEAIQAACGPDMDEATLMDTRGLPLQAWKARHEPLVAKMMRQLAENCPTLETVAWYPVDDIIWSAPARWLWKVHREKDSRAVRLLTNEFAYEDCLKGGPPALYILIGQELLVAEEHPVMVHRKYEEEA